ncbi:MAG TPA: phosphatase PAP2 family protein [Gemmatimonadales bacterium]|nr:phosphatase PAP2 family protein [Gemmatimonadales bacterium]
MSAAVRLLAARLGQRDRLLLSQWSLPHGHSLAARRAWIALTQLGSATVTIAVAVLVPVLGESRSAALWTPAVALTLSHLVVQLIKRSVQRDRPPQPPLIPCPDRFSFPSGHATSSLAIGLSLAMRQPGLAPVLIPLALLVGWSRVVLGVHYPGDVLAGQGIAAATVLLMSM